MELEQCDLVCKAIEVSILGVENLVWKGKMNVIVSNKVPQTPLQWLPSGVRKDRASVIVHHNTCITKMKAIPLIGAP